MTAYFILLLVPFAALLFSLRKRTAVQIESSIKENKSLPVVCFFIALFIMLSIRDVSVGNDTDNYRTMFERLSAYRLFSKYTDHIEWGFFIYCKILSILHLGHRGLIVISAGVMTYLIGKEYSRDGSYPMLKILLFVNIPIFPMLFSGIRQAIAFSIGVIAYKYVREKKILPFLAMVVLAFLFHRSGFMLLALYPVYHMKIRKKHLIFIIPSIVLVFIFNQPIFDFLTLVISDVYTIAGQNTGAYTTLVLFALFGIFSFVIPDEEKLDEETIGMRNILLLAICMQLFVPLHQLAMRMNYYFIVFIPMLIPKIIKCSRYRMVKVARFAEVVMCLFFVVYFFREGYTGSDTLNIFPYIPLWKG